MSQQTTEIPAEKIFDVRAIPCSVKHAQILTRWIDLTVGDFFVLKNDHDPVPLRYQFEAEFGGAFGWEYIEKGPEVFQVKISKTHEAVRNGEAAPWECKH